MNPYARQREETERARRYVESQGRVFRLWFALAFVLVVVGMLCCAGKARGAEPATLKSKPCTAVYAMEPRLPAYAARAWGQPSKFWPQNAVLRVRFLTGTAKQKAEAWKRFQAVDALVNLQFEQVTSGPSDIRVRFDRGKGHWSYIGTDARRAASGEQTMNLELVAGVFGDGTVEWDRVALHEICHSIGLEHEHQSPLAKQLIWNVNAVYDYYSRTQGWTKQQTDFQVLHRATAKKYVTSGWDATSLMEYPIPPGLANITIGWNTKLSPRDLAILRTIYP